MGLGKDRVARDLAPNLAGQGIEQRERLDLLVEQLDADRLLVGFGRMDIDHVAAHPVGAAREFDLVAFVLKIRQTAQDGALIDPIASLEDQDHLEIGLRIAQAIDGGNGRDDDDIPALQQGLGRGQAHLLDVLVDGGVLLDIGVGRGDVSLRLVVVVIGDEILHRIVREEVAHLAIELGRQRFVGRQDQGRALDLLDHVGDGEGLARPGDAEQGHARFAIVQPRHELADGLWLIAGGGEVGDELERTSGHSRTSPGAVK